MQKEITVIVAVNSETHADIIRRAILDTVCNHTTIYHITKPKAPSKFVDDYIKKEATHEPK
jgi:hypothetical protein